jgi:predicted ATPase/DNA-binding XRE family transcriptional regulator
MTETGFGELLRRYRIAAGLTQEELAERAGVSTRGISDLERGARGLPRKDTLQMLLQGLDLSPADRTALSTAARRSSAPTRRDASNRYSSVPAPLTPLIGRETEIAAVTALLKNPAVRLLTLTGPGGTGKTRLALAVAEHLTADFPYSVAFVPLAPLGDPAFVTSAIAQRLGVREAAGQSLLDRLKTYLADKQMLLILDNFEHLVPAAPLIADLLAACPSLKALVTSRAVLHLSAEQTYPVPPLALPDPVYLPPLAALGQIEAVRLFVGRVQAAKPDFVLSEANAPAVAEIVHRLDGLPLALELAAARVRILSPAALLARLDRRLPLLTAGAQDLPDRQRTLRNTIAWSYDLLPPQEQALFRRLAVFAGGWTLEAAEAVCDASHDLGVDVLEGMTSLVDHSLVHEQGTDDDARFGMLETVREFGLEQLAESGEEVRTRSRHAAYFLQMVHDLNAWVAPYLPTFQQILDHLEIEYPNVRAALAWQQETGDVSGLLELAGALFFFWQLRGHLHDGRTWLEWGLEQDVDVAPSARARGQLGLSGILYMQHDLARALAVCEEALGHYRSSGDMAGLARASDHAACTASEIWNGMASTPLAGMQTGNLELMARYIDASLTALAALGDAPWARRAASHVRYYRANVALQRGELDQAERVLREVVAEQASLAHDEGAEHAYACWPLCLWGGLALARGALVDALSHNQAALARARAVQELRGTAHALAGVAGVLMMAQRLDDAAWLYGATEAFCDRNGLAFTDDIWAFQVFLGVAPSWQLGDEPSATPDEPASPGSAGRGNAPPIPDATAAQVWVVGRAVPIEEAVAAALAVDLAAPAGLLSRMTGAGGGIDPGPGAEQPPDGGGIILTSYDGGQHDQAKHHGRRQHHRHGEGSC